MEEFLGHQVSQERFSASVGSRAAEVLLPGSTHEFQSTGWLDDRLRASDAGQFEGLSATVALRLNRGGMRPFGLLSGSFSSNESGVFEVAVSHSGDWPEEIVLDTYGLQNDALCLGLPYDFAQSVVDGLLRFDEDFRPSGRLEVVGAAFDPVDSSESVFELTAGLLKFVLLSRTGLTSQMLGEFLEERLNT